MSDTDNDHFSGTCRFGVVWTGGSGKATDPQASLSVSVNRPVVLGIDVTVC